MPNILHNSVADLQEASGSAMGREVPPVAADVKPSAKGRVASGPATAPSGRDTRQE